MTLRNLRREAGSAYLVTLLLLVVLTLLGLSLALVTGTESQIGANERILERVFYASDAGVGVAAARILTGGDYYYDADNDANNSYIMNETPGNTITLAQSTVSVGPMALLQESPCPLCEINNAGSARSKTQCRCHFLIPARGQRDSLANTTARRRIAASLDIQPWTAATSAAFPLKLLTPAELQAKATL